MWSPQGRCCCGIQLWLSPSDILYIINKKAFLTEQYLTPFCTSELSFLDWFYYSWSLPEHITDLHYIPFPSLSNRLHISRRKLYISICWQYLLARLHNSPMFKGKPQSCCLLFRLMAVLCSRSHRLCNQAALTGLSCPHSFASNSHIWETQIWLACFGFRMRISWAMNASIMLGQNNYKINK